MGIIERLGGLLFILSFLFYWFKVRVHVPKGYKLPPGPPRRFLVGNLFDIPLDMWHTYHKWSKIYGDLTYLNIFGTSILFVNSHKSASELFEHRGGIYSNRPKSAMLVDLAGIDWTGPALQPNEQWKKHRTILHRHLSRPSIMPYKGLLEKHSRKLLHYLYQSPEKFLSHSRHVIGAMIMEINYGIETRSDNDPYIELAESALKLLADVTVPGAYFVEFLPILKYVPSWVPGAGFKKKARRLNAEINAMATLPFENVKAAMKSGHGAPPSIVRTLLEEMESTESGTTTEKAFKAASADIYMAAIDTTETAIQIFFMTMLLYPDAQKKAQEELDKVIGDNAFPSFGDRPSLPYVEALISEVLRWHPVTPIAFPHMLKEDDIIGQYFVPKGTTVIGNTWSLLHSEIVYGDDVDKFKPERFINPTPNTQKVRLDSVEGCPGRHLADSILYITISNILYAFDISPYETFAGPELPDVVDAFPPGVISRPKPFKCKLTPRLQAKALLERF